MTTKRLLILVLVVLGPCALVFALPRQLGYQPTGIALRLPEYLGAWWGHDAVVTELEHTVLGVDTEFARKFYVNGTGDGAQVSIVLAGQDMMTSIHRPERCLEAQGWSPNADASSVKTLKVPGFGSLGVTRLRNHRVEPVAPAAGPGQPGAESFIRHESITYYWFVGYTDVAATHEQRVLLDLRDRVLRGYNQRWAMVMISGEISSYRERFGHDEAQTDALLMDLIVKLAPQILQPSLQRHLAETKPTARLVADVRF